MTTKEHQHYWNEEGECVICGIDWYVVNPNKSFDADAN